MNTAGLILAGGESRRFGRHKFNTLLDDQPLLDHVAARLKPQVDAMAVNLPRDCSRDGYTVLHEPEGERAGPLAGVLLGLEWAHMSGAEMLVTIPVDVPFLPEDIVAQLSEVRIGSQPVCAMAGGRRHGLCALWPVACLPTFMEIYTNQEIRTVNRMLDTLQVQEVSFEETPSSQFLNVNTGDDLRKARQILLRIKGHEQD